MTRHRWCIWVGVCALVACGGGIPADNDAAVLYDTGASADAPLDVGLPFPGSGTYEVTVVDSTTYAGVPFAGAIVALDYPGGGRREQTTDANGHTTFTDVDWSRGHASFVAWAPGYNAWAYVDIAEGDVTRCFLTPLHRTTHALTGNVLHRTSPSDSLYVVSSNTFAGWGGMTQSSFTVQLFDEQPFLLTATEFTYAATGRSETATGRTVAMVEVPGATMDTSVDIDLGAPLPLSHAHGHLALPTGASTGIVDSGRAIPWVTTRESFGNMFLGGFSATSYDATAHGFDYTVDYVTLPAGRTDTVITVYSLITGGAGEGTQIVQPGYPTDALTLDTFLPSPVVAPFPAGHGVHDVITFQAPPNGAYAVAKFFADAGLVYVVVSGARSDTIRVAPPMLPSAADEATVLGGPLGVQVSLCIPTPTFDCDHMSSGPAVPLF